jgi:hypothetical protein
MTISDEYEGYAKECLDWARGAKTDAERKGISRHGPRLDLGGGESERPGC